MTLESRKKSSPQCVLGIFGLKCPYLVETVSIGNVCTIQTRLYYMNGITNWVWHSSVHLYYIRCAYDMALTILLLCHVSQTQQSGLTIKQLFDRPGMEEAVNEEQEDPQEAADMAWVSCSHRTCCCCEHNRKHTCLLLITLILTRFDLGMELQFSWDLESSTYWQAYLAEVAQVYRKHKQMCLRDQKQLRYALELI